MKEHDDTVSVAIEKLRKLDFTDLDLKGNFLVHPLGIIKTNPLVKTFIPQINHVQAFRYASYAKS